MTAGHYSSVSGIAGDLFLLAGSSEICDFGMPAKSDNRVCLGAARVLRLESTSSVEHVQLPVCRKG